MKKNTQFLFYVLLVNIASFSEAKTLTLFTKSDCNNCNYTKHMLEQNGIAFSNRPLEEKENAIDMMQILKVNQYSSSIYLPVIVENDSLLIYPSETHNDSTLYFTIQHLISQKESFNSNTNKHKIEKPWKREDSADCEFQSFSQYIVCANFDITEDAEHFKNVLINDGYLHADILFYNRKYRVFAMPVFEDENEVEILNKIRMKYKGAYLLQTNEQ